jgi:hypothetical protein
MAYLGMFASVKDLKESVLASRSRMVVDECWKSLVGERRCSDSHVCKPETKTSPALMQRKASMTCRELPTSVSRPQQVGKSWGNERSAQALKRFNGESRSRKSPPEDLFLLTHLVSKSSDGGNVSDSELFALEIVTNESLAIIGRQWLSYKESMIRV